MIIHGVVVSKNDWGLLAVSINNALLNHVDVVHVLNHGSSDQTAHGLRILKELWRDRLNVYSASPDSSFKQSLLTNMIASFAEKMGADWIYVFDSDEFLLAKPEFSLRNELSRLGKDIVAVRYALSNYISTFDFNKNDLNCYNELIYKSKPGDTYNPRSARDMIYGGQRTFFDIPFPQKVIFRAKSNLLVTDGAHRLLYMLRDKLVLNMPTMDCAHLTLISRDILARKSAQGRQLIERGFPPWHGWQSQLLHQLDLEGRLDWFWGRHSIRKETSDSSNPEHTIDKRLVESLVTSVDMLQGAFGGTDLSRLFGAPLTTGPNPESTFTFNGAFEMCDFFNQKINLLLRSSRQ